MRTYPWGEAAPSCGTVVYGRHEDGDCRAWPQQAENVDAFTRDVTPDGVRALGGNVSEWVADAFTLPFYPDCGDCVNPRVDARTDPDATYRVVRGAGWDKTMFLKTARRGRFLESGLATSIGFRCAVDGSK